MYLLRKSGLGCPGLYKNVNLKVVHIEIRKACVLFFLVDDLMQMLFRVLWLCAHTKFLKNVIKASCYHVLRR